MPREIGGKRFRVSGYDTYVPARRRRLRRRRMAAFAGISAVVLATGGWYGYHTVVDKPVTTGHQAGATCPTPTGRAHGTTNTTPVLSALTPGEVTVNVYNDTTRTGLAAITAADLRGRGFVIGKVSNDPVKETVSGTAMVRGAKSQLARMQLVGAEVNGTQEVFDTRTDTSVDLVLGNGYAALAPTAQAASVVAADVKADAVSPSPTPTSTCK
jgi:hypothetical protein